ncbi:MAG TPA: N-acetylmuramoyl-L-alanine amidase [Pyrinomonadaceae bacterium]|jgi:N-acetyl-anhydromuramyl-L-alanine amidase AmpD
MDFKFETDHFPVVRAKFFREVTGKRNVRLVVMHSMEAPEKGDTAENVARFFQSPKDAKGRPVKASAHICVDSDSIIQCVMDNNVAFAAPGVNNDGIHIEQAGFARQKRAEWLDPFGILMLNLAANVAAQYCMKYNIPIKHLSNAELKDGERGIIGHLQATAVFKPNNGHTDPGPGYPWDHFLDRVQVHFDERMKKFKSL